MKKEIIMATLLAMLTTTVAWAAPIDAVAARKVAVAAMRAAGMAKASQLTDVSSHTQFTSFYVFTSAEGGFVIVSADDCVTPILGYSLTAPFPTDEEFPDHLREWLDGYEQQIAHDRRLRRVGSDQVAEMWQILLAGETPSEEFASVVAPLLTTTWNQSPYYNQYCPYDSEHSARTVTGCVATATAQIMKYWEHPTTGYGRHSYYQSPYGTLSANFGNTTYNWSSMPASLGSNSTNAQINAVATLMYHVGVADEMSYGVAATGGSGASNYQFNGLIAPSSEHSLMTYFKYRSDIATILRSDYTEEEYCARLRAELDQSRPILYSGRNTSAGHSFVLDGYDADGLFHVNWGWGGSCDGYFVMGSLNPGIGGIGGNSTGTYNVRNAAMLGIRPNDNWSRTTPTTVLLSTAGGSAACSADGSGTYAFGDTVMLHATAAPGYRFSGWSDGSKFNDRAFIANGGTYSFTANFVPITGDTLYYCPGGCVTSFGSSTLTDIYWGIKLPTSLTDPAKSLTAVQLFVSQAGDYDLTVYTGSNRSTTAYTTTVTYTTDDIDMWHTISVATPVDATKDIWITFHTDDINFPASYSHGAGVAGSFLWGSGFEDKSFSYGVSAMIKGIFTDLSLPSPNLDSNCLITTFPYTMDFEGPLACWSFHDANRDGSTWSISESNGISGSRCASISYAANSDEWLITPSIATAGRFALAWKALVRHRNYPETYQVWADYRDTSIKLFEENLTEQYTFAARSVEFIVDPGDTMSVRFRYISDAKFGMYLDSINFSLIAPRYTLTTASADTAKGLVSGDGIYDAATSATLTATPARHFHFLRWNDGNTDNPRQITIASDTLFTAYFEADPPIYHTVNVAVAQTGRGTVSGGGSYEEDSVATLIATPNYGYRFLHWNDSITDNPRRVTVIADSSFTAYFDYDTTASFTIRTLSSNANKGIVSGSGTYRPGSTAVLHAVPLTGYRLYQWSDGSTDTLYTITVAKSATYIAIFEAIPTPSSYTLTLYSDDNLKGSVVGSGTYRADSTVTIRAIANPGYHFTTWSDGVVLATRTITLTSDSTLTAYFEADVPLSYTLSVYSSDTLMGSVSGSGTYTEGSLATLTATANPGYRFTHWDDGNTTPTRTVVVNADASYTAFFEHIIYTLTVVSADTLMGTVSGSGAYNAGSLIAISAIPTSGHYFVQWQDGDTNATRYVMLTSDTLFTATFARSTEGIRTVEGLAISLTPNPATTTAILSWNSIAEAVVSVYSATGSLVETHRCIGGTASLDVSTYALGLYLVRVATANTSSVCKLIVK